MHKLIPGLALGASLTLAACAAPAVAPGAAPTPSPSVSPGSATASPPVAAAPSAAPSAVPTADSASPAGFSWTDGELWKAFDFKGVGGLYRNPLVNQILVVDAEREDTTTDRYVLRKFQADGSYVSAVSLAPEGAEAPDAVDDMAFDASGTPLYAYRDDGAFSLRKLLTATVTLADRYPVHSVEWAGPVALRAEGELLSVAVLRLDPEKREEALRNGVTPGMTGGSIYFSRAEEDEAADPLFQVPDPFFPTRSMAFGRGGDLYLVGQTSAGGFGVKRLSADQRVTDVVAALPARPERIWVGPTGDLYMLHENGGLPSEIWRYTPDGRFVGDTELRLKTGAVLNQVEGLTFDSEGRALVAGVAFDAAGKRVTGIFRFSN